MTASLSRFSGCMLGGALGDALGYPLAAHRTDVMFRTLTGSGHGTPEHLPIISGTRALVSAKTQMTLFTAEGLIRAAHRAADRGICDREAVLLRAYQRWLATQDSSYAKTWTDAAGRGWLLDVPELHIDRKASRPCLIALAGARRPNAYDGAEGLVRSAPIGLAAATPSDAFELATSAAALTNGDRAAHLSAGCFAAMIWHVARGARLDDAIDDGLSLLPERDAQEITTIASIARSVSHHGPPSRDAIEHLGRGQTALEALGIAILCSRSLSVRSRADAEEAIRTCLWRAAAHEGASDTTASLTGSLIGAQYGVEALPPQWLAELELRDVIEQLAFDLHATYVGHQPIDPVRYPPN